MEPIKEKTMIYTVTLSPALDYLMWLDRFEEGGLNRTERTSFRAGGKGINVSVVLKRLGIPSVCLGFTAGFVGQELIRLLGMEGIDHDFIMIGEGCSRINVKVKADTETEINASGPKISGNDLKKLTEKAEKLSTGDTLILSGKPPKGIPDDIYSTLISAADGKDVRIVVDTSGENLVTTLGKKPYLIKPNKAELAEISKMDFSSISQIADSARKLQDKGARNVLVSLGAEGALLAADDGRIYTCGIPEGKLIDSTGAGDSMVAGFIAKDSSGAAKEDCLRFAVACGSASSYSHELLDAAGLEQVFSRMPKAEMLTGY
jgi:1-phosphofructokinase